MMSAEKVKPGFVQFQCKVTLTNGKIKYYHCNLYTKDLINIGTENYKDEAGNLFEYDLAGYKDKIYHPPIEFVKYNPKTFKKFILTAYSSILWNFSLYKEAEKELQGLKIPNQELLTRALKKLKKKDIYELYIRKEYDEIYTDNLQEMNLTDEEFLFLKHIKNPKFNRETAFYIFLYRKKDDGLNPLDYDKVNIASDENIIKLEKLWSAFKSWYSKGEWKNQVPKRTKK